MSPYTSFLPFIRRFSCAHPQESLLNMPYFLSPKRTSITKMNNSSAFLCENKRYKSYVLKYLRGQLPKDLKDVNGTIGCLFGSLPDVDEYNQFIISKKVIKTFNQLGYAKLPEDKILDPLQVDILNEEINSLSDNKEHHSKMEYLYATSLADLNCNGIKIKSKKSSSTTARINKYDEKYIQDEMPLFYCQGQWRACWGMHDLIYHPLLTVPAAQILNENRTTTNNNNGNDHSNTSYAVRLWYDEVFVKNKKNGPFIPWQQNYYKWQHIYPINFVSFFIALDHLCFKRGAPIVIPGSHRWRQDNIYSDDTDNSNNSNINLFPPLPYDPYKPEEEQIQNIWNIMNEEEKEILLDNPPQTIELKRGEILLLHPLLLFATHENNALHQARGVCLHYLGSDVQTVRNGPLLPHTTSFKAQSSISGPFFPLVFDPAVTEELMMIPANDQATEVGNNNNKDS